MRHIIVYITALMGFLLTQTLFSTASAEDTSAVVLIYHRFGEDTYPTTNIRLEQLEEQINLLKAGGYHFMKLSTISQKLKAGESFPEKTITITIDDAYLSVRTKAWPLFKAAGIPITVFVATDTVDANNETYMSWDDIRALKADGVEIGHHTASHLHMVNAGIEQSRQDIQKASKRFQEELGEVPKLFAYPYGEYSAEMIALIKEEGFEAAYAQFSGPAGPAEDLFALPRFPINEKYGGEERFKLVSSSMALPVHDVIPASGTLDEAHNPPAFGFTIDPTVRGTSALACYPSHLGAPATIIRPIQNRIEVRFDKPFPKGRNRINCTMPAGNGRWYWFGRFFLVPGAVLD